MYSPLHYHFKTPPTYAKSIKKRTQQPKFIGDAYRSPFHDNGSHILNNAGNRKSSPHTPTSLSNKQVQLVTPHKEKDISYMSLNDFSTPNRLHVTAIDMPTPTPFKHNGAIAVEYRDHVAKPMTDPEEFHNTLSPTVMAALPTYISSVKENLRQSALAFLPMQAHQENVTNFLH